MAVEPPLELARVNWVSRFICQSFYFSCFKIIFDLLKITQLHDWLGIVCDLPRIQSSRYDEGLSHDKDAHTRKTYREMVFYTSLPFLLGSNISN
jgi:hypothetical protein